MSPHRSKRPAGLSREAILAVAVSIVQDDGVEQLSVRRITQKLGVSPMAIYNYFASKQEILGAVLDALIDAAHVTGHGVPRSDWRVWTTETFVRTYESLRGRRDLIALVGDLEDLTPASAAAAADAISVLQDVGFSDDDAVRLYATLIRFVMGAAVLPMLRVSPPGAAKLSPDESVRRGIETIIDGFAVSSLIDLRLSALGDTQSSVPS